MARKSKTEKVPLLKGSGPRVCRLCGRAAPTPLSHGWEVLRVPSKEHERGYYLPLECPDHKQLL